MSSRIRPLYVVRYRCVNGWKSDAKLDFDAACVKVHSHSLHRTPHSLELWGYCVNGTQYSMDDIANGKAPDCVIDQIGGGMPLTLSGAFDRH